MPIKKKHEDAVNDALFHTKWWICKYQRRTDKPTSLCFLFKNRVCVCVWDCEAFIIVCNHTLAINMIMATLIDTAEDKSGSTPKWDLPEATHTITMETSCTSSQQDEHRGHKHTFDWSPQNKFSISHVSRTSINKTDSLCSLITV